MMKLKAQTVQEFRDELLLSDKEGILAIRTLFDMAMKKWKDEPEKLAELAIEMLNCACLITKNNPSRLTQPYGILFAEANHYAAHNYKSDYYERYGKRLTEYYWSVFSEDDF